MVKYVLALAVSAAAAAAGWIAMDKTIGERCILLRTADQGEQYESKSMSRRSKCLICGGIALACMGAMLQILRGSVDILGVCQMSLGLICMAGAGCNDYREHRIPNIYPAVLTIGGIALLVIGLIVGRTGAMAYAAGNVIAAVACVLFLEIVAILTKQGIGPGDIKLIGALALATGVYAVIGTLFFSVVLCSVITIAALIFKRKTVKSAVPFGPFLLIGYIATILINNY